MVCSHCSTRRGQRRSRRAGPAQAEGVAALGVEVKLRGDAGLLQGDIVGERLLDGVDVIVLGLQQKGRRRVGAHADVRPRLKSSCLRVARLSSSCARVAGIGGDGESPGGSSARRRRRPGDGSAAQRCVLTAATRCPPAEKPMTPTLCGSTCHCAACWRTSPRVRCASCSAVWTARVVAVAVHQGGTGVGHPGISNAGDAAGGQPVADLRCLRSPWPSTVAAAGENDHGHAGIAPWGQ